MKKEQATQQDLEDLTLLLAYLTSWDENKGKKYSEDSIIRTWKGYDFDILDSLQEKNLITMTNKAKSLFISLEGVYRAKILARKFLNIG